MRINEGKLHRIASVKSAGDRAVRLRFDNGKTYTVDLRVLIRHSRGLKELRGASLFARVANGDGGVVSSNLQVEYDLWQLRNKRRPKIRRLAA